MAKFFRHTAFVCGLLLAGCGSAAPAAAPASSQAAPASAAKPAGSGAVASAAKPAASSAAAATVSGAPSALANWQAVLDQTTAGAKQEGAITIASQPGQPIRDWINEFSKKYPFVKIEYTGISGNDFVTRVLPEQKAGQYLWDISLGGPSTYYGQLIPANAMDPVLPQLFLPEVLDDSKWTGGFKGAFADTTEQYILSMQSEVEHTVAVNRDSVPASQLTQVEDVIDPKWKGKVSLFDPRYPGAGAVT
ncbi:MAG TPA: hypothetical protein VKU60_13375, partial [Chloroflexota bacterium]|nr:hypothetical protein [Chloroflexota bacterium]